MSSSPVVLPSLCTCSLSNLTLWRQLGEAYEANAALQNQIACQLQQGGGAGLQAAATPLADRLVRSDPSSPAEVRLGGVAGAGLRGCQLAG